MCSHMHAHATVVLAHATMPTQNMIMFHEVHACALLHVVCGWLGVVLTHAIMICMY